jgi:hypothetical protein
MLLLLLLLLLFSNVVVVAQLFQLSPLSLLKDQPHPLVPAEVLSDLFPESAEVMTSSPDKLALEETLNKFDTSLAPVRVMLSPGGRFFVRFFARGISNSAELSLEKSFSKLFPRKIPILPHLL